MEAVLFPDTTIRVEKRVRKRAACPQCGALSRKRSTSRRQLRDLGLHHPLVLEVVQSVHYCTNCHRHFKLPVDDLAEPGSRFTRAVKDKALASVFEDGLPIEATVLRMLRDFHVHVPASTLYDWMVAAGEKSRTGQAIHCLGA